MPLYTGFIQLGAGLSVGLAGLAAGFAIGIVGDAGVRGTAQQPRLFVGMVRQALVLGPLRYELRRKEFWRLELIAFLTDPYPHFRRGTRIVRVDRRTYPQHELERRLHGELQHASRPPFRRLTFRQCSIAN